MVRDDVIEQVPPLMIGDKFEKGLDLDTYKKRLDGYGDKVSIVVGASVISMFETMILRVQSTASFSFLSHQSCCSTLPNPFLMSTQTFCPNPLLSHVL